MWGLAVLLGAAFAAGLVAGGGPALWISIVVGLVVYGGDPGDPLGALLASTITLGAGTLIRARLAALLRR